MTHHARRAERDPEPAHIRALAADQRLDRLEADVGREHEELDRDELLRALLGGLRRTSVRR